MIIKNTTKHLAQLLLKPDYARRYLALRKLYRTPRYTPTSTNILGTTIQVVDSISFIFMYREIFEQQIYRFKAQTDQPVIIDGGANIGLSVIYFKQLYPKAKITAFEPDSKVFETLNENMKRLDLEDVNLVKKALWTSEGFLDFMDEGADGGRVVQIESDKQKYQVLTVRLREYLNQPIDFLKIDIEGAETEVIRDCVDLLQNVQNLFVEYHSFVNQPQTLNILINILAESGFRLHIHSPFTTSSQPFYHRNIYGGMDTQLNIFAFRQH